MRVSNTWPVETYEWAMRCKGVKTSRETEALIGISYRTIEMWWTGTRPRCHGSPNKGRTINKRPAVCKHGHAFTGENTIVRKNGELTRRECRKCARKRYRAYRLRQIGKYHPELNPDPALLPLDELWVLNDELLPHIEKVGTVHEIRVMLAGPDEKAFWTMRTRKWTRYTIADRLCTKLGIVLSALDMSDPVFNGRNIPSW